jgi:hypothetical protein
VEGALRGGILSIIGATARSCILTA